MAATLWPTGCRPDDPQEMLDGTSWPMQQLLPLYRPRFYPHGSAKHSSQCQKGCRAQSAPPPVGKLRPERPDVLSRSQVVTAHTMPASVTPEPPWYPGSAQAMMWAELIGSLEYVDPQVRQTGLQPQLGRESPQLAPLSPRLLNPRAVRGWGERGPICFTPQDSQGALEGRAEDGAHPKEDRAGQAGPREDEE